MLFNNKLFNSIACLLSFTNLQLVITGRTWILLYLGRTVYKGLWACLALNTDETVLSLQALRNMYLITAENLCKARERSATPYPKKPIPIQPNQLVTLKVHTRKTLDP